jgi:F-type H+-transporting ATPase subunit alpha
MALTNGLLDSVPLEKMRQAQSALRLTAEAIPAELQERVHSDRKLNDADRSILLQMATAALLPFQVKS